MTFEALNKGDVIYGLIDRNNALTKLCHHVEYEGWDKNFFIFKLTISEAHKHYPRKDSTPYIDFYFTERILLKEIPGPDPTYKLETPYNVTITLKDVGKTHLVRGITDGTSYSYSSVDCHLFTSKEEMISFLNEETVKKTVEAYNRDFTLVENRIESM